MSKRVTPSYRQHIGRWGEQVAEAYLLKSGLELVGRNVRTASGEIDLVMSSNEGLVFVEVKTRTNDSYGMPEAALTETKQTHLLAAAQEFLQTLPEPIPAWRVDVVAVRGKPGQDEVEVTWFENALA
jgi:putative endonuclease